MAAAEIPMQGSLGHIIWTVCYLSVLIGLSAYGVHRYFIIYLYLKNRKREPVPARYFDQLPKVTVQLPIFNEVYVVERLLRSVSELEYPGIFSRSKCWMIRPMTRVRLSRRARTNCASAASMFNAFIVLIARVSRLARWPQDWKLRKASSSAFSTLILSRNRSY